MNRSLTKPTFRLVILSVALLGASSAGAQTIRHMSTFATGTTVNASQPDSIALGNNSLWVSYANGADSTGLSGSSTVVQYKFNGEVRQIYSIPGSVDGLKVDPKTGLVWALQNQDGNSTLTLIDPKAKTTTGPIPYAVTSGANGYDDVVFRFDKVFLSYTNPASPTDPTIQLLQNGSDPLVVTPILLKGATGKNLATGMIETTTQNDPDSLKLAPNGDLMLSSGDDGQLIFVSHPGSHDQSVSFLSLLDPNGAHVSGLDDAVFATVERGRFYVTDTNNNRVLRIDAEDLPEGSLYASVGSLNEVASVDLETGKVTAFLPNLNGPHGILFLPNADDSRE
jgi:DNA-binding beta-propeller fold protein YncE